MDKLAILNSIEIVDWDANSGELEYLLIKNIEENRKKLLEIGVPEQVINEATDDYDFKTIDIASIGFIYTDAHWFNRKKGFVIGIPSDEEKSGLANVD